MQALVSGAVRTSAMREATPAVPIASAIVTSRPRVETALGEEKRSAADRVNRSAGAMRAVAASAAGPVWAVAVVVAVVAVAREAAGEAGGGNAS